MRLRTDEVEPPQLLSPANTAVIGSNPLSSELEVKIACAEPSSVPVPSTLAPFLNVIVPTGVTAQPDTSADRVTSWPRFSGLMST